MLSFIKIVRSDNIVVYGKKRVEEFVFISGCLSDYLKSMVSSCWCEFRNSRSLGENVTGSFNLRCNDVGSASSRVILEFSTNGDVCYNEIIELSYIQLYAYGLNSQSHAVKAVQELYNLGVEYLSWSGQIEENGVMPDCAACIVKRS